MSEDEMRDKARELIRAGRLPDRAERVWGGTGLGKVQCALCGELLQSEDVVLEVELQRPEGASYPHLHVRCFSVYENVLRDPVPPTDEFGP